jgi:hypothetical protein
MGRALGFRADAKHVYWAIVDGTRGAPRIEDRGRAAAPVAYSEAAALSWYRERARHLVETYGPDAAMIRSPEQIARGSGREGARRRLRIEGVLLEAMNSCGLPVITGALATISSRLGTRSARRYLDSGEFRGLDLSTIPGSLREAVLVAVSALPQDEE